MTTTTLDVNESKPRRRTNARATARPVVKKTKVTLVLDDDVAKRLGIHAVQMDMDRSQIVNQLVRDNLKRFRVLDFDRPEPRDTVIDRQDEAA